MRRFLMHVLPKGFHRIRHYGFLANGHRAENVAMAHDLLGVAVPAKEPTEPEISETQESPMLARPCPRCGGPSRPGSQEITRSC